MEQGQLSASDQNAIDLLLCVCVLRLTQIIENGDIEINTWAGRFNLLGHADATKHGNTAVAVRSTLSSFYKGHRDINLAVYKLRDMSCT